MQLAVLGATYRASTGKELLHDIHKETSGKLQWAFAFSIIISLSVAGWKLDLSPSYHIDTLEEYQSIPYTNLYLSSSDLLSALVMGPIDYDLKLLHEALSGAG